MMIYGWIIYGICSDLSSVALWTIHFDDDARRLHHIQCDEWHISLRHSACHFSFSMKNDDWTNFTCIRRSYIDDSIYLAIRVLQYPFFVPSLTHTNFRKTVHTYFSHSTASKQCKNTNESRNFTWAFRFETFLFCHESHVSIHSFRCR